MSLSIMRSTGRVDHPIRAVGEEMGIWKSNTMPATLQSVPRRTRVEYLSITLSAERR